MTTYDDADLFSDAFTGFTGVSETPRRSRKLGVLALVVAALVVVGALIGAVVARNSPAGAAVDPASLVPILGEPQGVSDVIAASDRDDLLIDPTSSRLLLADDTTSYYAATSPGDKICLVAIPSGDLARTACASTTGAPSVVRLDDVMIVPTGATAPAGWHETAANVYTRS